MEPPPPGHPCPRLLFATEPAVGHSSERHAGVRGPLPGVGEVLGHRDAEGFAVANGEGEEGGEDEEEEEGAAGEVCRAHGGRGRGQRRRLRGPWGEV